MNPNLQPPQPRVPSCPQDSHGDDGIQRHLLVVNPPAIEGGQPLLHKVRERSGQGLADRGVQVCPLEVG